MVRSRRFPWIKPRGKRFLTVRMDTTNKCNLRCSMCPMRLSDKDPDRRWINMDPNLWNRISSEVFPLASSVSLSCGAEPLMNPEFPRFLKDLYMADVPVREMVTNGTLLNKQVIQELLRYPPTSLFVSIDGATSETHAAIRNGADLDAILSSIRNLIDERNRRKSRFPMVSFSVTLQKRNLEELPDIVRFAGELGVDSVNVVLLVPYAGLDVAGEIVNQKSDSYNSFISRAVEQAASSGVILNLPVTASVTGNRSDHCQYVDSWVFIDPDGLVDPCPYWNISEPLGDLSKQNFQEIWTGPQYTQLRAKLAKDMYSGNCKVCPEMPGTTNQEINKI
jgi:radical SAM protein with 4Fe4S-binding SPASM domain